MAWFGGKPEPARRRQGSGWVVTRYEKKSDPGVVEGPYGVGCRRTQWVGDPHQSDDVETALELVLSGTGGSDSFRYRDHPVAFAGHLVRCTPDSVVAANPAPGNAGR